MKNQTVISAGDSAGVNFMPPRMFLGCLCAGVVLELLLGWPDLPGNRVALMLGGIGIAVLGTWFMMWGHGWFRKLGVNVPTNLPVSRLVTNGAHGYSRNPMYVGFVAILLGAGVAAASLWMVLAAVVMTLYLALYVIPREEAYLSRRFGREYEVYRQSVRRWL